jgi:hypothetical protein
MTQITVNEEFQTNRYLLVSRIDENQSVVTTRIIISDENTNTIKIVSIEQGPQGDRGEIGPSGLPGLNAPTFDILPISSGGTNNNIYTSGNIIYYDGNKLSTSQYSIQDILDEASLGTNAVTGVLAGSGLYKTDGTNTVTLDVLLGDGLQVGTNNEIIIDDTIARVSGLTIDGILPINKGGTNNTFFTQNRLVYFDGLRIRSFPIATGNFLFSGVSVNIVAGSGLVGGGNLQIPNGTVAINIPSSADIIVEDDLIKLSTTGTPGLYSKILTDNKGRVVSGTSLTTSDIIEILGYTPFHPGNDGAGSNLDADLLDGYHGNYYSNAANLTGFLNPNILPSSVVPGLYTKVGVGANGLISGVFYADQNDIISSLGYTPVPSTGFKTIAGTTTLDGDIFLNGELNIYDNLPILATNNSQILPDTPRGVSFIYGGLYSTKTGILAYYPASDELRLVTNVFASGADTDAGGNQDDLNGGNAESVYILQNLDGNSSTILLRSIADGLYVKKQGDEDINGQKVFVDTITFRKQIRIDDPAGNNQPPFFISSNTNKVINLNSDLLDDQHGSYYRNAANITGSFSYQNVTFDHIQGTNRYIAKFNDTRDPAGKIDDSVLYQNNADNIVIDNNQNLIIGDANISEAEATVSIGSNHVVVGDNNLIVGINNAITGNNSVVFNSNSKVNANNSIALGDYGYAYTNKQIAHGVFNVNDNATNQRLEHGQYTTISMHLAGIEAGNSWVRLQPSITIPNNKTFAYNLDLLVTKAFGTGVAQYKFESGIFKNATFRDSNNITNVVNLTTQPQVSKKLEIFNNSQFKNHYHTFEHTNGQRQLQDVAVTHPPIKFNTLQTQNTEPYYLYEKTNKSLSGTYYKTNNGDLVLDLNKPIYSGNFTMNTTNRGIQIISKNHGVKVGSVVDLSFTNITGWPIPDSRYKVYSVPNEDTFFVERPYYSGYIAYSSGTTLDYAHIKLSQNSLGQVDKLLMVSGTSATINSDGYISSLSDTSVLKYLRRESPILIQSGDYLFSRFVTSFSSSHISTNSPIATGTGLPQPTVILTGPVNIYAIDFSHNLFARSSKIFIDTEQDGEQFLTTSFTGIYALFQGKTPYAQNIVDIPNNSLLYTTGNYLLGSINNTNTIVDNDYNHLSSTSIVNLAIPKRSSYPSGRPVQVLPLIDNSGSVFFTHQQSINGSFEIDKTLFNKYRCIYTRYKNSLGDDQIIIYHTGLEKPINLSYSPIKYELTSGYGDDDNTIFEIINHNDRYRLQSKYAFNYENKNIFNIRIKATDQILDKFYEKNFTITVNNSNLPYGWIQIPHQTIDINDICDFNISSETFRVEENGGPLSYSANLQNNKPLPSWLLFNSSTLNFSGSPQGYDLGTYNIRVTANNNSGSIYRDFYLTITDRNYQTLEYFDGNNTNITDIILNSTTIDENLPSGAIISYLGAVGGYDPYLEFITGSNTFNGLFTTNSDIVMCTPTQRVYPTTTISGTSNLLEQFSRIRVTSFLNLNTDLTALNIYKPFMMSGTPGLIDGNLYLTDGYQNYDNHIFSGMSINTSGHISLPRTFTILSHNDYAWFVGGREALLVEADVYPDTINTETGYDIVIKHSLFTPMWMATEQMETEPTGIVIQTDEPGDGEEDRLIVADAFTENILWARPYPDILMTENISDPKFIITENNKNLVSRHFGALIGNTLVSFTPRDKPETPNVDTAANLDNINNSTETDLQFSNIKYNYDSWSFRDPIDNPVFAAYGIGSGEFCRIKTENDFILDEENNNRIISTQENHHGTRIVLSTTYELLDKYNVVKDNGRLMATTFDGFIAENNEPIVHDYAIAARSGDVCILYPGNRYGEFKLIYEADIDLSDTIYSYYYNWGKLIPFTFINSKSFIRINDTFLGNTTTTNITYYDSIDDNNYPISGLKSANFIQPPSITCLPTYKSGYIGFESSHIASGGYITGFVDIYTEPGTGTINLYFNKDINLDNRDQNSIYLRAVNSNNPSLALPEIGQYNDIDIVDSNHIKIYNSFLMPNMGVQFSSSSSRTGSFEAVLDENHGYIELPSTLINRVPVEFLNTTTTLQGINNTVNLKPKDYTFDIINISGNKIYTTDSKNYFLKETSRPDYYDQNIKGKYLTNGIAFTGSLFNNHANIYDIRYNFNRFIDQYRNINFQYSHSAKELSFSIESGMLQPFDSIVVTFPSGTPYSSDRLYALLEDTNIGSITSMIDLEPYKDSLLLETSKSLDSTATVQIIKITGLLSVSQDVIGSCIINNNLTNRLQSGLLINHNNSSIYGYEINSIVDGFTFTGIIPKNHNIISTNITGLFQDEHVTHASIFGTGNSIIQSGLRILKQATSTDIGYVDYYLIDSNSTVNTVVPPQWYQTGPQIVAVPLTPLSINGIGSASSPYRNYLSVSGSTPKKYIEFLYLGHNNNTLKLEGLYNISGNHSGLQIYHTTFEEQVERYRNLVNREVPVTNTLIFTTGNSVQKFLDLTLNIKRFDKIRIEILTNSTNSTDFVNDLELSTYVISDVLVKPYLLESPISLNSTKDYYPYINPEDVSLVYTPLPSLDANNCIDCATLLPQYIVSEDPSYSSIEPHNWYILPYIRTNNLYCGDTYKKNQQVFFNGNIIRINELDTIKSFSQENDEFLITSLNGSSISLTGVAKHISKFNVTSEFNIISGISINGNLSIPPKPTGINSYRFDLVKENTIRYNSPLGISHNLFLPSRGNISVIKATSGQINVLNYNNLYYNTYGGISSYYPLDTTGKFVQPPQTGRFSISFDSSLCTSGTLCVHITGYNTPRFTGVYPGKTLFFDFNDGAPELTQQYTINDLLQINTLSINIPYNSNHIGKSGIVYIIDSVQNIKSHLNPNIDNGLIQSNGSLQGLPINPKVFDYYDYDSKTWKHTAHLRGNQPPFTGYNISLSSTPSKFYSINPNTIKIDKIQYSFGNLNNFNNLDNHLIIPDNIKEVIFKITTKDGDLSLFDIQRFSIPKIGMSGVGIYQLEFNEPGYFGWNGSGWNIGLRWNPPVEYYANRELQLYVSDLTGRDDYNFTISQRQLPSITPFYPTGYVGSGNMWKMGFDLSKIDVDSKLIANELFLELTNVPDSNHYSLYYADDRSVMYSGDTRGVQTGLYPIILTAKDITSTPYVTLGVVTGFIKVLNHISSRPDHNLQFNNLTSTYYINLIDQDNVIFDIPAELGPLPNEVINSFNLTFNTSNQYSLAISSSSYDYDTERFRVIAIPKTTGQNPVYKDTSGRFINQSVSVSLKQPIYDIFGNYIYQTYNKNAGFNIVFYKPLIFEGIPQQNILDFDIDEPWSIEFYISSGITEHDQNNRPNAKIINAPNLGTYETDIPQYSLDYQYDSILKKWKVQAVATKDALGRFIGSTGLYPLTIFIEDEYSGNVINKDYSIRYNPITKMKNISSTVYTTPNNEFFTKVDMLDLNSNAPDKISFPAILKESSISLPNININRKYDTDLNIWTNSYISTKMTDKYDARLVVEGSTVSVECKGVGKDKIMAVGKLSTMEIESNELAGIPLKITGITSYSSDPTAAIQVSQGNAAWELQFKTIGGLAHANYPPTIILDNMPTFCTGFNPLEDTRLQCLIGPPVWNPIDQGGSWSYRFVGIPSCILLGRKEFSITAIDTDTSLLPLSPYLPDTDQVSFAFNYNQGVFIGNPPSIVDNPDYSAMTTIKPLCNTYYTKQLDFGPGTAALCSTPTGIKSFSVSGSVPSGLSYSIYFPEEANQPAAPYSNLGSGYVRIEGYPTEFANGGQYSEQLLLTVTDARDRTVQQTVTFTDSSSSFDPDVGITVYFSTDMPTLTPKSGLKPILSSAANIWTPPALPESLVCRSILPHNKCVSSDVLFSGTEQTNSLIIYLSQPGQSDTNKLINTNDIIYIGFDQYNNGNDGTYQIYSDQKGKYINGKESLQIPGQTAPITGYARVVTSDYRSIGLGNFDNFFAAGNIKNNTTACLLGAGRASYDQSIPNNTQRGLLGLLVPSHQASLTGSQPFSQSDSKLSNLVLNRINNQVNIVSAVSWSDCWQTGNLYISGIVLPKITVEIVDPPPAQDYYFSFNGVRFALATKLAFGDNATQRLIPENERYGSLRYELLDLMSNSILQQGSVGAGSSFDTNILSRASGTIYKINIIKDSDTFPTYNVNALPGAENSYIWPHKGDNLLTVPTNTTFAPILTDGFNSISVINSLTDQDPNGIVMEPLMGLAIGGYIPDDAGIGDSIPYNWSGNNAVSGAWTTEDYLPSISGIIQQPLLKNSIVGRNASYTITNGSGSIVMSNTNISANDTMGLKLYTTSNGITTLIYNSFVGVSIDNIVGNNFVFPINLGPSPLNCTAHIDFKAVIENVDLVNNQLILRDNFTYSIGDSIGVDLNNFVSSELNLLEENGYVTVTTSNNNRVYLSNTNPSTGWLKHFSSGNLVSVYKNIDDNIKIMPYNISYLTEGKYAFQITGRSNTRENEDLIYKIATMENPNMPVFDTGNYPSVGILPKKHFQNYPLYINKPIKINTSTVNKTGNLLTFSIEGGKRPLRSNIVDIQLAPGINGDYGYCGFWRQTTEESTLIKDEYDSVNDRLNVKLILSPDYGFNWSTQDTIKIRIADETGVDTYMYTF